jgi:hypothetical protein
VLPSAFSAHTFSLFTFPVQPHFYFSISEFFFNIHLLLSQSGYVILWEFFIGPRVAGDLCASNQDEENNCALWLENYSIHLGREKERKQQSWQPWTTNCQS